MEIITVRSHTGKYHKGIGNVTLCSHSGQVRSSSNRPATDEEIKNANINMFCKKCFNSIN
jgi:hypothetical protein